MKIRKILLGLISAIAILWSSIFLFVQYKTDAFIQKFSADEVQISYDKLCVKFGIKNPLTIVLKNVNAVSHGMTFSSNLYFYPRFSHMIVKIDLSIDNQEDHLSFPIIVTTKKSQNKNIYTARLDILNAALIINGCSVLIDGGIEFSPNSFPRGGYNISISNTTKLLDSKFLHRHPDIAYKTQKILSRMQGLRPKFRLDYTDTGMKLDGIAIESL